MRRKKALKERRKKLFDQLGEHLESVIKTDPAAAMYILDLWRYIADVHKEGFSVEIEK